MIGKGKEMVGNLEGDFASKLKRLYFLIFLFLFPSLSHSPLQNCSPSLSKKPSKFVVKMVVISEMTSLELVSPLKLLLLKKVRCFLFFLFLFFFFFFSFFFFLFSFFFFLFSFFFFLFSFFYFSFFLFFFFSFFLFFFFSFFLFFFFSFFSFLFFSIFLFFFLFSFFLFFLSFFSFFLHSFLCLKFIYFPAIRKMGKGEKVDHFVDNMNTAGLFLFLFFSSLPSPDLLSYFS